MKSLPNQPKKIMIYYVYVYNILMREIWSNLCREEISKWINGGYSVFSILLGLTGNYDGSRLENYIIHSRYWRFGGVDGQKEDDNSRWRRSHHQNCQNAQNGLPRLWEWRGTRNCRPISSFVIRSSRSPPNNYLFDWFCIVHQLF